MRSTTIRNALIPMRMAATRALIRLAMRTCIMGYCHDYLVMAIKSEGWDGL